MAELPYKQTLEKLTTHHPSSSELVLAAATIFDQLDERGWDLQRGENISKGIVFEASPPVLDPENPHALRLEKLAIHFRQAAFMLTLQHISPQPPLPHVGTTPLRNYPTVSFTAGWNPYNRVELVNRDTGETRDWPEFYSSINVKDRIGRPSIATERQNGTEEFSALFFEATAQLGLYDRAQNRQAEQFGLTG
ncbi:MAG: hypothetical protein ABIP50_00615 [Candidatus Saccharimonadales bacterium]